VEAFSELKIPKSEGHLLKPGKLGPLWRKVGSIVTQYYQRTVPALCFAVAVGFALRWGFTQMGLAVAVAVAGIIQYPGKTQWGFAPVPC
jgi:hypothetical protein